MRQLLVLHMLYIHQQNKRYVHFNIDNFKHVIVSCENKNYVWFFIAKPLDYQEMQKLLY